MNVIPYTPQVSSGRSVVKVDAAENAIAAKKAAADKVAELAEAAEPRWKKKITTNSSRRVSQGSTTQVLIPTQKKAVKVKAKHLHVPLLQEDLQQNPL